MSILAIVTPDPFAQVAAATKTMVFAGALMLLLELTLVVAMLAAWLCPLVHCIKNRHDKDRLLWVLVVLFGGPFGGVIYMAMGRPAKSSPALATAGQPPIHEQSQSVNPLSESPARRSPALSPIPVSRASLLVATGPFEAAAMRDEKARTRSISEACWAQGASRLGKG